MSKKYVLYVFCEFKSEGGQTPLEQAKDISNEILKGYDEVERIQIRDPLALREEFAKQLDLFLG